MFTLAMIIFVLISLLLVLTILMQSSKGGGLASSFGGMGGGSFLGARGTANFLQKATMVLGILYGAVTLLIGISVSSKDAVSSARSEAEKMFEQQKQEMVLPAAPFNPSEARSIQEPATGNQSEETPKTEEDAGK